ncbi:MAG TPA: DUF732 domain-containing protein [Mycobacterium sp.]|jgi:hypothetical protein|nr:DUF732 domain-containing protein [Mycobacterium sp.]
MAQVNVGPQKWSAVGAVLLLAALFSAAPASADATDAAFVAALAKERIVVTDQNTAVAMAHAVCAGFDNNAKSGVLALKLMKQTDLSLQQSGYFLGASISAYCPQYIGRTDNSARWLMPGPPLM